MNNIKYRTLSYSIKIHRKNDHDIANRHMTRQILHSYAAAVFFQLCQTLT